MVRSVRTISVTLTAASVLSAWVSLPQQTRAQSIPTTQVKTAAAKYTYNPQLVRLYTNVCTKKMREVQGKTSDQAAEICQCSITKMQHQHSQMQAIQILTKAQASIKNDPKAMPSELSPFFTPCISIRG
ncbi:MAG: hypothetical protein HC790_06040 [Acaryochloridaceae cyanobacterium CSU_3_4]|nr:hypothetical protein [Acaryochloridaceae cyanobacterium CSU_3_4]